LASSSLTTSQSTPVFRSSTNLVQVPVVVRDGNGRATGSLHAEDFLLLDNGKLQTISRFSVEKMGSTEEAAAKRFENPEASNAADAASGGDAVPDRFVALLVDDANLSTQDFIRGRNAALHFIDTLRPDQRVAVYSVSGSVALDFTNDHELLKKALESVSATDRSLHDSIPIGDGKPPCRLTYFNENRAVFEGAEVVGCPDGGTLGVPPESITWAELYYIMTTWGDADEEAYFTALKKLVAKMAVLPGDRSILLLSPGTYMPARFRPEFKAVLAGAQRAKIVISGVDARGVLGSGGYSAAARFAPAIGAPNPVELGDQVQGGDFMAEITSATGGSYVHSDNDLDGAIRRAESTPEFIYLLAFAPTDTALDGKRHEIAVQLKNARGLSVQARSGYFAASASDDPADEAKRQIEDAFFSNQDVTGLPVTLRTAFFKDGNDATLTVTANVDAAKLGFQREGERNLDNLTLVVGVFDQNGNFVSAIQKDMQMRLKDMTLSAWLKSGIVTSTDFQVTPGKYLVRLVVRDANGSSIAEQSTGVEIPW
jgi:VWFA-related protein